MPAAEDATFDFTAMRRHVAGRAVKIGIYTPWSMSRPGWAQRMGSLMQGAMFAVRVTRADLGNFFLFEHRAVDGFLVTGKNSGTHWLKFMLSCAIAQRFDVEPPAYSSGRYADTIIGHPGHTPRHRNLPRIGSSHNIPSIAFAWGLRRRRHPPIVLLVRDIREAMLSNYVKWRSTYDVPLSTYVRGDPSGRRFIADIWWYIHFFNRWAAIARRCPDKVLVVRYEDLIAEPELWLQRVGRHLSLDLTPEALEAGIRYADRSQMRARLDPKHVDMIIPQAGIREDVCYSRTDREQLDLVLRRHLRYDFGYGYVTPPQSEARRTARSRVISYAPVVK